MGPETSRKSVLYSEFVYNEFANSVLQLPCLLNCLDKELIAYKTLSKCFIQALYSNLYHWSILHKPPPGLVQIAHCIHKISFKVFLLQPVS